MKVDKAYSLKKGTILHNQKSYVVPSWIDVSSNHQKEIFLRKVISNGKSNKISFIE